MSTVTVFFSFPFLKAVMEPSKAPLFESPAGGAGAGAGGGGGELGRVGGGGGGGELVAAGGGGGAAGDCAGGGGGGGDLVEVWSVFVVVEVEGLGLVTFSSLSFSLFNVGQYLQ